MKPKFESFHVGEFRCFGCRDMFIFISFQGMSFIVSPNTVPDFEGMSAIIKSAGGQVTNVKLKNTS